jgi:orotidine-5'-phosphate decarboxylase
MKNSPIILALDVSTATEARKLVEAVGDSASFFKVGLELYTSTGTSFARWLKQEGHRVFLDLKLHDIGETVRRAVSNVAQSGVDFLTIHGTRQVMQAAVAGRGVSPLKLLAVSVLTSLDQDDLIGDGYSCEMGDLIDLRARNAIADGVDGIVCPPRDAARVRSIAGPRAILVTPGVRSAGAASDDQKRVATPAEAIAAGADYLVIGRQVTHSQDPRAEMLKIIEEISAVSIRP